MSENTPKPETENPTENSVTDSLFSLAEITDITGNSLAALGEEYHTELFGKIFAVIKNENNQLGACFVIPSEISLNSLDDNEKGKLLAAHRQDIQNILTHYRPEFWTLAFVLPNVADCYEPAHNEGLYFLVGSSPLFVIHAYCDRFFHLASRRDEVNSPNSPIAVIRALISKHNATHYQTASLPPSPDVAPSVKTESSQGISHPSAEAPSDTPSNITSTQTPSPEPNRAPEPQPVANTTSEAPPGDNHDDKSNAAAAFADVEKIIEAHNDVATLEIIKKIIEISLRDKLILLYDVELSVEEVIDETWFLPVILVVAALEWAPVVIREGGAGGFSIHLKRDSDAATGYRLESIKVSSPAIFSIAVSLLLHRLIVPNSDNEGSQAKEVIQLDWPTKKFEHWLIANGFDSSQFSSLSTRVTLS